MKSATTHEHEPRRIAAEARPLAAAAGEELVSSDPIVAQLAAAERLRSGGSAAAVTKHDVAARLPRRPRVIE